MLTDGDHSIKETLHARATLEGDIGMFLHGWSSEKSPSSAALWRLGTGRLSGTRTHHRPQNRHRACGGLGPQHLPFFFNPCASANQTPSPHGATEALLRYRPESAVVGCDELLWGAVELGVSFRFRGRASALKSTPQNKNARRHKTPALFTCRQFERNGHDKWDIPALQSSKMMLLLSNSTVGG